MEYLKNVVVQYLSLRDGSQRATLERVRAAVAADADLKKAEKEVEKAAKRKAKK